MKKPAPRCPKALSIPHHQRCTNVNNIFAAIPMTVRRKMRRSQTPLSRIVICPPTTAPRNIVTPKMIPSF